MYSNVRRYGWRVSIRFLDRRDGQPRGGIHIAGLFVASDGTHHADLCLVAESMLNSRDTVESVTGA
jgi:hypothetical protein